MALREHPPIGTILLCDFDTGFQPPEMVKRRPVIVVSPRIRARSGLCTVVALSTTVPRPALGYHARIDVAPPLPAPFASERLWVKGDMIYAVSLARLDFLRAGKDGAGRRLYHTTALPQDAMRVVQGCILTALGLGGLMKHLP